MDTTELLGLYDRHERREVRIPGFRREEAASLLRMVEEGGGHAYIAWSSLDESTADAAIEAEVAHFAALGLGFEWKTYSHDRPQDLVARLEAHGFEVEEEEAIMALELSSFAASRGLPDGIEIRRLSGPEGLADYASVERSVWSEDPSAFIESLARSMRAFPDYQSVYVAYAGDLPVCAARINFPEGSPFASVWGGSTLKDYRGRGIYSSILALRLEEARRRGYSFVTIDASPMSRPIVAKQGFRLLALSRPCTMNGGSA
jgi:GNAT superfamily N-acetyltransferase